MELRGEVVEVLVGEVVEADGTEGGDEVVAGVVAVADPRGGLEPQLLRGKPVREVLPHGLVGIGADTDTPAGEVAVERGAGEVLEPDHRGAKVEAGEVARVCLVVPGGGTSPRLQLPANRALGTMRAIDRA